MSRCQKTMQLGGFSRCTPAALLLVCSCDINQTHFTCTLDMERCLCKGTFWLGDVFILKRTMRVSPKNLDFADRGSEDRYLISTLISGRWLTLEFQHLKGHIYITYYVFFSLWHLPFKNPLVCWVRNRSHCVQQHFAGPLLEKVRGQT